MEPESIIVHGMSTSGNGYKVRLLLEQLGRRNRWVDVDSAHGATRTPDYLARNPNGKVPMLEAGDGHTPGYVSLPPVDAEVAQRLVASQQDVH